MENVKKSRNKSNKIISVDLKKLAVEIDKEIDEKLSRKVSLFKNLMYEETANLKTEIESKLKEQSNFVCNCDSAKLNSLDAEVDNLTKDKLIFLVWSAGLSFLSITNIAGLIYLFLEL